MSSTVGLSATGLTIKRQSDIIADLEANWRSNFGSTVNLAPESYNGQIIGIMSEQIASLYELLEAIYNSNFPSGAEGSSVDNILALNGLKRLTATSTVTQSVPVVQSTGVTLYGLVLTGTPGTTITAGSLIADTASPAHVFSVDANATIQAAANAVQTVIVSSPAQAGSYRLTVTDGSGNALTTGALTWQAQASDVQTALAALTDPATGLAPFTDVAVQAISSGYTVTFGGNQPASGQPSSGSQAIPLITIASNTLMAGVTVVNISVADTVQGSPAEAIATATATSTGPSTVLANTITVIQTPITGWTGVNNPLDCVSGTNLESDSEALARRSTLLSAQAQGPLAAVLQKVLEVSGVSQALAFPNLTNAALQTIKFASVPTTGTFSLTVNQMTTSAIAYNAAASDVQTAIQAISELAQVKVTGSVAYGFVVDFNGALGGQAVPLISVAADTTGVPIVTAYGRPPKSVEIVAEGGTNAAIAQAIYSSAPAGIATYGAPVLTTTVTTTQGSNNMVVADTTGLTVGLSLQAQGVPPGSLITAIQGNSLAMSNVATNSYSNVAAIFTNDTPVTDSNGNTVLIGFSRPQPIPIYVELRLVTDQYNTPGVPSSGTNLSAKWNPASVSSIQSQLLAIGNAVPIGGTIIGFGTNGLVGSFNSIPGIVDYTLYFDVTAVSQNENNIQMLAEQVPYFSSFNVTVSFS